MASIPDFFRLRENSIETNADFANQLRKLTDKLKKLLSDFETARWTNTADVNIELADLNPHWAYKDSHPLSSVANMGMPEASEKLNPKEAIYETIKNIKKIIDKKAKSNEQIRAMWEKICGDWNLGKKELKNFPGILNGFIQYVENLEE